MSNSASPAQLVMLPTLEELKQAHAVVDLTTPGVQAAITVIRAAMLASTYRNTITIMEPSEHDSNDWLTCQKELIRLGCTCVLDKSPARAGEHGFDFWWTISWPKSA